MPKRARMWKFSIPLNHPETGHPLIELDRFRSGLERNSIDRYMWLVHDRDPGSAPHLQGVLKLCDSRTREQAAAMLEVPVQSILPLIDKTGQHGAFERYCRYLLHESPEARADGKFHYSDDSVRANFNFRGMIDHYFSFAPSAPVMTADSIKLAVYRGEMSLADVEMTYPIVHIRHLRQLETLHQKGEDERHKREVLLERAVHLDQTERLNQLENTRRQELAEMGFGDDDIDLALKEDLADDDLFARRAEAARLDTERKVREEHAAAEREELARLLRAERETPEFRERARLAKNEAERQLIVAAVAIWLEIKGDAEARDAGVCQAARSQGFTLNQYEPGEVLSIDDARAFYCDIAELRGTSGEDLAGRVLADLAAFRNDLIRIPHELAVAEFHAADGNLQSFDRALDLRTSYSGYPDLFTLPSPRGDLPKKQREMLLSANGT